MSALAIAWFVAGGCMVVYFMWLYSDHRAQLMLGMRRWTRRCMVLERAMMVWSLATFVIVMIGSMSHA